MATYLIVDIGLVKLGRETEREEGGERREEGEARRGETTRGPES